MLPFHKVVFPVDYSGPCNAVIPYVKDVLHQFQASLTLVHAYGPEALAYSELAITEVDLPEEVRLAEERRLRGYAQEYFPGLHVETILERGDAGVVVDRVVKHQGADLVMLATHGHGALRRFLLGSVTTKILHDVSTAVWTGMGTKLADHDPGIPYRSILCAVDFTDEGEALLRAASAVAQMYQAKLLLVHAVETPPAAFEVDFSPYKKEIIDSADFNLRELKSELRLDAPHTIIDGPVAEGIRDEALRHKVDLIITGRGHAQGGISRLWSNLYGIIRESPCPVLSV